jgi:hypothetical protein
MKGKQAISLIISYITIIVVVIALASITYISLQGYIPLNSLQCQPEMHLAVYNLSCTNGVVKLKLQNDGLFNVSAAYIRLGKEGREVRSQINKNQEYFSKGALAPEEIMASPLILPAGNIITEDGYYILEIQPALFKKSRFIACEKSIASERIYCTR